MYTIYYLAETKLWNDTISAKAFGFPKYHITKFTVKSLKEASEILERANDVADDTIAVIANGVQHDIQLKNLASCTCNKCGGLMQEGKGLKNTLVSIDDFGNDSGQRGTTQTRSGPVKAVTVMKCQKCGHSYEI